MLTPLWDAYRLAGTGAPGARARSTSTCPSASLSSTAEGKVDRVDRAHERLAAHRLIEEFMILANVAAAEALEARRQALIYRVHDEPSIDEDERARAISCSSLGIKLAKGQVLRPAQFNGILVAREGHRATSMS